MTSTIFALRNDHTASVKDITELAQIEVDTLFVRLTPLLACGPLLARLVTGPHRHNAPSTQQAAAQLNRRAINPQAAPPPDQIAGGLGAAPPGKRTHRNQAARKATTHKVATAHVTRQHHSSCRP